MKRLLIIGMLLAATAARAFDFMAQAPTGQQLYYTVIDGTTEVKVVNPNWNSENAPSGLLKIPATVSDGNGGIYQVREIGSRAFMGCTALTGVVLSQGVRSIGQLAFGGCTALDSIVLPAGITQIGMQAFNSCAYAADSSRWSAEGVLYMGNYAVMARQSISGEVSLREGTTLVGNGLFFKCTHLEKVVMPSSLTGIGAIAFQNCTSLDTLEMHSTTPPSLEPDAFLNAGEVVVMVPCHTAAAYAAAENWSSRQIEEDCSGEPAGIEAPAQPTFTATAVEDGLWVVGAEGGVFRVSDALGRRIAVSRGGFIALPQHGLYVVTDQEGHSKKIVY